MSQPSETSSQHALTVSVIVAFYNGFDTINQTLDAILQQTYPHIEIVLVDDGSRQGLEETLGQRAEHHQIKIVKQANKGVPGARNTGLSVASGDYIAFCDQDDLWLPTKIEQQIACFENRPELGLVYTWCDVEDTNKNVNYTHNPTIRDNAFQELTNKNFITCSSALVAKKALDRVGHFVDDKRIQGVDDRNLWIRIAREFEIDVVKDSLVTYVVHGTNYSLNRVKMLEADIFSFDHLLSLPDLTRQESDTLYIGKKQMFTNYAMVFFYHDQFQWCSRCLLNRWKLSPINLAYLALATVFKFMPNSLLLSLKQVNRNVRAWMSKQ